MSGFVTDLLGRIPEWAVYLSVFLLPFLEASVLLGFVFPGETVLIFGGVLAGHGGAVVWVVLGLAIAGAVLGDSTGYVVGRRFGGRLQQTRLGRLVGEERWRTTEEFLHRRGPLAVFFGRFTALLRAMVPGAAGMARVHYGTFLFWNVVGGVLWASLCVLGGWLVGDVISRYVTDVGYFILVVVVLAVVVVSVRKVRERRRQVGPTPSR